MTTQSRRILRGIPKARVYRQRNRYWIHYKSTDLYAATWEEAIRKANSLFTPLF